MGDSQKKVSDEEHQESIIFEEETLPLLVKERTSIDKHMNNYTKLLTGLVNVNVKIEKENKALILLNSLPDEEYETFALTLINGRQTLNYSDVSATFVNYKVRR